MGNDNGRNEGGRVVRAVGSWANNSFKRFPNGGLLSQSEWEGGRKHMFVSTSDRPMNMLNATLISTRTRHHRSILNSEYHKALAPFFIAS